MSVFGRLAGPRPAGPVEFIIAGLGNPGKKYENTRHNAGFMCLDVLCERHGFEITRSKFDALTADTVINGKRCLVMKPQTFMNSSGTSIEAAASFYKLPPEKVIVIFDDIDIPFGDTRVKRKGSAGSHNGIKSIVAFLGGEGFPRVKIGVGGKPHPDYDLKDFVLGRLTPAELDALKPALEAGCDAVEYIVGGNMDRALERCQIHGGKQAP